MNKSKVRNGAGRETRTPDLRITNALLYRLSYSGSESVLSANLGITSITLKNSTIQILYIIFSLPI